MQADIGTPEAVGLSSERLERIVPWMRGYVEAGKLPGLSVTVARRGRVVFSRQEGLRDLARGLPMDADTIVRIYSMTKPLTSTAILMLYEEGRFQLDDPITRFLPEFRDMRVLVGGSRGKPETVPAERDITFRDLLTHTSGLSYGFMDATLVDRMYREEGVDFQTAETSLAEVVGKAARLPLLAQPGRVELQHRHRRARPPRGGDLGKPFDDFLRERIIRPLGMVDTDFHVPAEKLARFASNYALGEGGRLTLIDDARDGRYAKARTVPSGGGGLVSTASDYARFCRFILGGGALDGVRLLGRKTVALMTANHLRGDLADMGQPRFSESSYSGIGFGLGFSVMLDPAKAQILGTPGEVAWGGAASTAFWIDPAEDLFVIMLTQLMPSSTWPIRRELRVLTYAAITG